MTREQKQQFTLRITQANSTEMVVILYEMLLCYMDEGRNALNSKDRNGFREAMRKSRACLGELMNSLRLEYGPGPSLRQLYLFCIRRLAWAEGREKEDPLSEVERVIVPLRDAYGQIAARNQAGPVMKNSQTVIAGLTYGKNSLTENMADQGTGRGMYV